MRDLVYAKGGETATIYEMGDSNEVLIIFRDGRGNAATPNFENTETAVKALVKLGFTRNAARLDAALAKSKEKWGW
jgi:Holliday junction resolvasome RuvABC DNA-binding subunit